MAPRNQMNIRLLTLADLHQAPIHYNRLPQIIQEHRPQIVALVGDFLNASEDNEKNGLLSEAECAKRLSELDVNHLLFVRGNHEDANWAKFVRAWPLDKRPLTCLYGTAFIYGPLVILGFQCTMGWEGEWARSLPKQGNNLSRNPAETGRKRLGVHVQRWLKPIMRTLGPAARTIWLMHQPPAGLPIAAPIGFNPWFTNFVDRYQPLLTISGHDHNTPHTNGTWHTKVGNTTCVNVGQELKTGYCIVDFEFQSSNISLPKSMTVTAFQWKQSFTIKKCSAQIDKNKVP
jgi:Icc-related predicted phosphoesterase